MTRWCLLSLTALSLVACSPDDDDERHHGSRHSTPSSCSSFTTCGSCTPVLGCGWCSFGDGAGKCASGPSACGSTFRWNWEPADCPPGEAPVDAGAEVAIDAAPEASVDATPADVAAETTSDAGESDASEAAVCNAPTTFTAGCARTTGGALCTSAQYSVGCHASGGAIPKPDATLGCTSALTTSTSTYYCCPCK